MAPMLLRSIYSVFFFLFNILGSWVLMWLIQMIAIAITYPFTTATQRQDMCGWIFRTGNMLFSSMGNLFWRTKFHKISGKTPEPSKRPTIYVMNHLSNADPWVVIRAFWPVDCKWVCKGSLFNIPFGGWCLRNAGDLEVKFTAEKDGWGTEKGSVRSMMEYAKTLLERNQPLAVFPEGVRSPAPEGPVGEFKAGFFDLAVQTGADIVPIAISGTDRMWPRKGWQINTGTAYISIGDVISAKGQTADAIKDLTWKVINEMRDEHPDRKRLAAKRAAAAKE